MTGWIDHAIFWHIYPLGFVGAEPAAMRDGVVKHRLGQIINWLDYVVELGASGLLLGPIFASSTHGYDTIDYLRIDARLGDEADFEKLIEAARQRGLRIVLDGVFNHVGRDFPALRAALQDRTGTGEASWFPLLRQDDASGEPDYATFEGHHALVTLNHEAPAVADHVVHVMNYWLDRGISGWRLDAAYAVPRRFWTDVLRRVRDKHPQAYLFGEVIHGDYSVFVRETEVDAVTQYELWKAIWSALNDRNLFELAWALDRHNGYLDTFVPMTFVGNHDVTRLASRLDDERHIAHALAILLTVGGTPCIYAGDEQAFRGIKENRAGGDDAIRPAFPIRPGEMLPFGQWTYRLHQQLIGLRRCHPWLRLARTQMIHIQNRQMVVAVRADCSALIVVLNLDDKEAPLPTPEAQTVLAGNGRLCDRMTSSPNIEVPAHGWAIVSTAPRRSTASPRLARVP